MIPSEVYELARALDPDVSDESIGEAWRLVNALKAAGYGIQPTTAP